MLSAFKDNHGIRSLYMNDTSPASQRESNGSKNDSGNPILVDHNNMSNATSLVLARALRRNANANAVVSSSGQQRCQRCWKVFHIGPLTDRSSYICWRCEYAICPNCREVDARGAGWKCCSCVKPMSLMRLFETTKSGREIVLRVMEFCDPRSERILKSFFRFASLYAISSSAAAGRGAGVRQQLSQGVANRIKAHLEVMQRESPPPSSFTCSLSPAHPAETPSRFFWDDELDEEDPYLLSAHSKPVVAGSSTRNSKTGALNSQRSQLGALSPNIVGGSGSALKLDERRPLGEIRSDAKENSLDRLRVSESTHRCSTQFLDGNVERKRLSGRSDIMDVSSVVHHPVLEESSAREAGRYSGSNDYRSGRRDGSEKALFVDDDDDDEHNSSPLLKNPHPHPHALIHGGAAADAHAHQQQSQSSAMLMDRRSESPAPRFPNFSTFLEDQSALMQQQQHQHPHQVPVKNVELDCVSVSSDSEVDVVELGVRVQSHSKSAQRAQKLSSRGAGSTSPGKKAVPQARPSGSLKKYSQERSSVSPSGRGSQNQRSTRTSPRSSGRVNESHHQNGNMKPESHGHAGDQGQGSSAMVVQQKKGSTPPPHPPSHPQSPAPTAEPVAPKPTPAVSSSLLVRTDSVLQAFERLASNLAEKQRLNETKSHPVVLTGTPSASSANNTAKRYPYAQRSMQESSLYRNNKSSNDSSAPGSFQRTASALRYTRTASNNPNLRPHKSTTSGPRSRTNPVGSTSTHAAVPSGNGNTASSGIRTTGIRVVHQVANSNTSSVYSRLYGNGTKYGNVRSSGYGQTNSRSGAKSTTGTGVSRTSTPASVGQRAGPAMSPPTSPAAQQQPTEAPDVLTRLPSSHMLYTRVPSSTTAPLNRMDTALPNRLQRSHSNPSGSHAAPGQGTSFSRTASRIALTAHADPTLHDGPLSARRSPRERDTSRTPREGTAGRRHTPTPMRATTPLQRQETQVTRLTREPSSSNTFARIPTTKNFERLCSMNRNHGRGDDPSPPSGESKATSVSAPPENTGITAIAALANIDGFFRSKAKRSQPRNAGSPASQSPDGRSVQSTTPTQQRTPRSLLLSTPRLSPRVSPRPTINSQGRSVTPRTPGDKSGAASASVPTQHVENGSTPSPVPARPPLSPPSASELHGTPSMSLSMRGTSLHISPSQRTPGGGGNANTAASGGAGGSNSPAQDKSGKGKTLGGHPVASPSAKSRPKVSIHTTTLGSSSRAKMLGNRVPTTNGGGSSPSTTPRGSATALSTTSRSPAASLVPKKRTGATVRLK